MGENGSNGAMYTHDSFSQKSKVLHTEDVSTSVFSPAFSPFRGRESTGGDMTSCRIPAPTCLPVNSELPRLKPFA